jgi:pSer/pThr/pTyr-binding forkhead associated (FHA) protein
MSALELRIRRGDHRSFARLLDADLIKIGRQPSCGVVLEGENVCRIHALIERDATGTEYSITHLGAAGKTYLNGASILRGRLAPGDEVVIGDYHLLFDTATVVDERDIVLIETADEGLMPTPLAPVLWAATADEMSSTEPTGEVYIEEPVILLTEIKAIPVAVRDRARR